MAWRTPGGRSGGGEGVPRSNFVESSTIEARCMRCAALSRHRKHNKRPIRRRTCGFILMTDQSDQEAREEVTVHDYLDEARSETVHLLRCLQQTSQAQTPNQTQDVWVYACDGPIRSGSAGIFYP
eukprot:5378735-Pyramimonas_sp.AAC.1